LTSNEWIETQLLLDVCREYYLDSGYSLADAIYKVELAAISLFGTARDIDSWNDVKKAEAVWKAITGNAPH
jgi:hypothetical protein